MSLTAKQQATVDFYTDPTSETYNNWYASYRKANYSQCKHWQANADKVRANYGVNKAIEAKIAKRQADIEDNIESFAQRYKKAYEVALKGNQPTAMVYANTGWARLYGFDKDNDMRNDGQRELDEKEAAEAKILALNRYKGA